MLTLPQLLLISLKKIYIVQTTHNSNKNNVTWSQQPILNPQTVHLPPPHASSKVSTPPAPRLLPTLSTNMVLQLGDPLPDFTCESQVGPINFHSYLGSSWGLIISCPSDHLPVPTTEFGEASRLSDEFISRQVKILGINCSGVDSHQGWIVDVKASTGQQIDFPILSDADRHVTPLLGMTAGNINTVRTCIFVSPSKKVAMSMSYPVTCGMNFHEILRVIDSLQMTEKNGVSTPVNWVRGQDCMLPELMDDGDADEKFDSVQRIDVPSRKGYLRIVKDPN